MKIGTDVSIQTCREEGYLVMEYKAKGFSKDTYCVFTESWPTYARGPAGLHFGDSIIRFEYYLSYTDLIEAYTERKSDIDAMNEGTIPIEDNPSPRDVLSLADTINMYCGLDI